MRNAKRRKKETARQNDNVANYTHPEEKLEDIDTLDKVIFDEACCKHAPGPETEDSDSCDESFVLRKPADCSIEGGNITEPDSKAHDETQRGK